jgi:hypothetical protein
MLKLSSSSMLSAAPELERFRVIEPWSLRSSRAVREDFSCDRSGLQMPAEQTLVCDLKTEVDFMMPRGADFEMRLENRSRL